MRSFEEVRKDVESSSDKGLIALEKEIKEHLKIIFRTSLNSSQIEDFKEEHNRLTKQINELRLKREFGAFDVFKKELKATYLPESSVELSDLVYEQALLNTKVMDDITKNYELLVIFLKNIKKIEQKGGQ